MFFSLCFGFFFLSVLTCASVSLNIYYTMPPSFISSLRMLFDFIFALLEILLKMIYILLLFVCSIFGNVIKLLYKITPFVYKVSSGLFSVLFWIMTQIVRGILGIGDKATNALSWMFVLSAAFLYIDNKYWSENKTAQNHDNVGNNVEGVARQNEQIERNVIVHREDHDSNRGNSDSTFSSEYSDSDEEIEQIDLENRHNENEANFQHEEEHIRMRDDNERNINVERNRLPNAERNASPNLVRNRILNIERNPEGYRLPNAEGNRLPNAEGNRLSNVNRKRSENAEGNRLPNAQQELEMRTLCSICFENDRSVAVFPCGHTHMCLECVQNVLQGNGRCPLCQAHIEEHRQVYF